jgi:cellulose synthase/poly-beta-1,6-N-acetylglucosamine synthase-like glycosyltransferase
VPGYLRPLGGDPAPTDGSGPLTGSPARPSDLGAPGISRTAWPPWFQAFLNWLGHLSAEIQKFLAPVLDPLARFGRTFGIPLGAVFSGLVLGAVVFACVAWLADRPTTEGAGTNPIVARWPWEEAAPAPRAPWAETAPPPPPRPAAAPEAPVVPVYGKDSVVRIPMQGAGEFPSLPLPRARGFVFLLVGLFAGIAFLLLFFYGEIFNHYDHLVALAGTFLYWPIRWPGIYTVGANALDVPDYIFPMYLSAMIAFAIASGLAFNRPFRHSRTRRVGALGIVLFYVAMEVFLDALLFTVPGISVRDFGLLVRTLTGGLFMVFLTFCAVYLPKPQRLPARFARDRGAVWSFLGVAALAVALSAGLVLGISEVLKLNTVYLPFTLLLLVPLLALTVFGAIARPVYFGAIRRSHLPPLSEYHPSVSIVMPAYNEEEWIEQTILAADTAAGHYPGEVEIIVGCDGSTDRTLELARRAIGRLQHAKGYVADLPHGGKSNALNGALALARHEIVLRCDADTHLSETPGFGEMMRHFADPTVGGVQGALHPYQKTGWTRKLRALEVAWMHYLLRPANMGTRSAEVIDGLFSAFRRKDLVELGGWVPWNGEDTEIAMRVQRLGYRIRIEFNALAFEDVPKDYDALRRQRVRWGRGILMANGQHYPSLFGPTPEYCGLSVFFWFLLMMRSGVRSLVYLYLVVLILVLGVPALLFTAALFLIAILIRAVPIGYFLLKMQRPDMLLWIPFFPIANVIKQSFRFEAYGTLGPGAAQEYI